MLLRTLSYDGIRCHLFPFISQNPKDAKEDFCHACMHGLIHDGQLRACQLCLLGSMYALKVNVHFSIIVRY